TKGTMSLISLPNLHEELRAEAEAAGAPLARRLITAGARLQQLAIWLPAGGVLPEHGNPGEARLHLLHGQVRFIESDADRSHTLTAGDLYPVPDALHRVEADAESLLLLSFVPGA
ncbi:MAG: cupin domain-containing protein, partial [Brachybacterium sp.]